MRWGLAKGFCDRRFYFSLASGDKNDSEKHIVGYGCVRAFVSAGAGPGHVECDASEASPSR
jgi:hypothetical protein